MTIKTDYGFKFGDLVETSTGERGHVQEFDGWAYLVLFKEQNEWAQDGWYLGSDLTVIVCEYCETRKGCDCQERIDAHEAEHFRR